MRVRIVVVIMMCLSSIAISQPKRFAAIGNSITSGTADPRTNLDTYPAQLRTLMGDGYDIQNFAVSGRTLLKKGDFPIWDEQFFADALAYNPEMVTIMLGTNDSKPQNWAYKDQFVQDYIAMIDTFRALEANPDVYLCLPPPAFSVQWGIEDSVITTDIIPMIQQVSQETGAPVIDFYTPFINKKYLFPDDIHPQNEGCWEFAQVLHTYFTGDTLKKNQDINLALNCPVETPMSFMPPGYLVDGDRTTVWTNADGQAVVIDLEAIHAIDNFQILFQERSLYRYLIETSVDNTVWEIAADKTANQDSCLFGIEQTESIDARYVRLTINRTENIGSPIPIVEFKVMQAAPVHAPILSYDIDRVTAKSVRFNVTVTATISNASIRYIYGNNAVDPFITGVGYRTDPELTTRITVSSGKEKDYLATCFKDGYEAASDTLSLDYQLSDVEDCPTIQPEDFSLKPNYPNPFNASTMIPFHLREESQVEINLMDIKGRIVKQIAKGVYQAGEHQIHFQGNHLTSGVYLIQMIANKSISIQKMVLVK